MTNTPAPTPPPKIAEALAFLQAAEQSAATGDQSRIAWTVQQFDQGISRLRPFLGQVPEVQRWLGLALLGRANVLRARGAQSLAEVLRNYDEAAKIMAAGELSPESEPLRRNDLGNVLTNRAITLIGAGAPEQLTGAVKNLDEAIALRRELPAGPDGEFHSAHAASWMNRADALTRLNGPENLQEALRSYDEAIAIMRGLPIEGNDWYRHRLAVAWMNRGITSGALGGPDTAVEAMKGFDECIALLRDHRLLERPEGKHLLACAWLNKAGALLTHSPDLSEEARAAAQETLKLLAGMEDQQPGFADVGLKARHAVCRAVAAWLAQEKASADARDLIGEATDAVDDGMALARLWEERGVPAFKPIETELFRFGALIYQQRQPQFLAEFVLENLDPERSPAAAKAHPQMMQVGMEALQRALQEMQKRGFGELGKPGMERTLETLADLRAANERLGRLRAGR